MKDYGVKVFKKKIKILLLIHPNNFVNQTKATVYNVIWL